MMVIYRMQSQSIFCGLSYFSRSMEMSRRWQRLLEEGLQLTKRRSGSGQKYLCTVSRRSSMTLCVFCVERLHFHCSLRCLLSCCYLLLLPQICWEKRKDGDIGNDCLISVDGTDCPIPYQQTVPEAWYTKKFNGHGLRYEIGVCIITGYIVWLMGPFPCGDWPDIVCFRYALKQMLDASERVEADDGYIGEDPGSVKVPGSVIHDQDPQMLRVRGRVRRRHEGVNKLIKQFKVVGKATVFRHSLEFHADCFTACTVLTQLQIENGHPLYDIGNYYDPA